MRLWKYAIGLILMLGIFLPNIWAQNAPKSHSFALPWQEQGRSHTLSITIDNQSPAFAVEPEWNERKVWRGHLTCNPPSSETVRVGVIWDRSEHKLYVDLNQDDDLTNDPNGVLTTEGDTRYYHNFPAFEIDLPTPQGTFRYRLHAEIYSYNERNNPPMYLRVLSGYSGMIVLQETEWALSVNDGFHGTIDSQSVLWIQATLQPNVGNKPLGYETNTLSRLPVPQSLYLNGHCYDLAFEYRTDQTHPTLWCTLTEKEVPLADLDIQGQFIDQLAFGNSQMLVLPPLTEAPVTVPAGSFTVKNLALRVNQDSSLVTPSNTNELTIEVKTDQQNIATFGGPLTNSVDIERNGSVLEFNFTLCGAGGEPYSPSRIINYDRSKKPKVTIYKGNLKLASADFEYG